MEQPSAYGRRRRLSGGWRPVFQDWPFLYLAPPQFGRLMRIAGRLPARE
jgi:hypothetical protein